MSDILVRIKRAVLNGQYAFSEKARLEIEADCLTELDIAEAILNATSIYKTIRSTSPTRRGARERLYVIESTNRAEKGDILLCLAQEGGQARLGRRASPRAYA